MIYDLENETQMLIFKKQVDYLLENKLVCKLEKVKKTRTNRQNSSLHKWFDLISIELNNIGLTFIYKGISGKELEMRYTPNLVKEMIIKPIMVALFNIESTTKLTTNQINELITIINKFFGEKGIYLPFPSIETMVEYYE